MTKTILASFIGTLTAGAVVIIGIRILGPIPLSITQTTTNKQSTFDVTGNGSVTTSPDQAEINLGIQEHEDSVQKAQQKGNEVINKIIQGVTQLGIDKGDIKTLNYNLSPNYDYQTGSQRITGYSLNMSLQIKIKDFTKINQVLDTAISDGANQVGGVSFTLSDAKNLDVQNQARVQAITKAKEKATSLSQLAGFRLGRIINVTENTSDTFPRPYPMMAKSDSSGSPVNVGQAPIPPTDVQPGSTTFMMTVTLSYETL